MNFGFLGDTDLEFDTVRTASTSYPIELIKAERSSLLILK